MTNVDHTLTQTDPTPDFNGMSPEAFNAGSSILDIWSGLEPRLQAEVFPLLIERLGHDLLQEDATDEQLSAAMEAVRHQADSVQHALQSRDARRRPQDLRPEDY